MKKILIAVLAFAALSAHASRTPEAYCVSKDGMIEVKIFNDTSREREAEVSHFNGTSFMKSADSSVMRKDTSTSVNFLGEDFGLSIELEKPLRDGFHGNLNFSSTSYAEPVVMICRLSR